MIESKHNIENYVKEFEICKQKRKELIMKLEYNNYSSPSFVLMMTVYFTLVISIMVLIIQLAPKSTVSLLIFVVMIFAMVILFFTVIIMKIDKKNKLLVEILSKFNVRED